MEELATLDLVNNIVIVVVLAAFCLINCVSARDKIRIYAFLSNLVMIAVLAGIFAYQLYIFPQSQEVYSKYHSVKGTFSAPMKYTDEVNGYFIVDHSIESYAIPVADVDRAEMPKKGQNCIIYLEGTAILDTISDKNKIDIAGKSCYLQSDVVAMVYDPDNFLSTARAVLIIIYLVSNLVCIALTSMRRKKEKQVTRRDYNRR